MVNTKEIYLTEEGLEKARKELERLKFEVRPNVISALKDARALGDLSENAEYDSAKNEQAEVETKIKELEDMIEKAIIVTTKNNGKVGVGNNVTLLYVEDNEEEVYTIVGSKEVDPFNNKISNESPIAKAIIGREVNDIVTVESPNGKYNVKIVDIK